MSVENNLKFVNEKIRAACVRVGRDPSGVRLLAVSKGQPLERIEQAFHAKQKWFGENYVQEALPKVTSLSDCHWHFIGALQSNKVKQVVGVFDLIHSVDRESLLKEISKRAVEKSLQQDILLEINLAGETSKSGMDWKTADSLIKTARGLPGLRLRGLMGMPPAETAEASRPFFKKLREQWEKWRDSDFTELSMGTSQDYEVAVEEGATIVRVGTEIFGPRRRE